MSSTPLNLRAVAALARECREGAAAHGSMDHPEESALFIRLAELLESLLNPVAGYALVPVMPTAEMVKQAEEAYMPFGDMELAVRLAILSAPGWRDSSNGGSDV